MTDRSETRPAEGGTVTRDAASGRRLEARAAGEVSKVGAR